MGWILDLFKGLNLAPELAEKLNDIEAELAVLQSENVALKIQTENLQKQIADVEREKQELQQENQDLRKTKELSYTTSIEENTEQAQQTPPENVIQQTVAKFEIITGESIITRTNRYDSKAKKWYARIGVHSLSNAVTVKNVRAEARIENVQCTDSRIPLPIMHKPRTNQFDLDPDAWVYIDVAYKLSDENIIVINSASEHIASCELQARPGDIRRLSITVYAQDSPPVGRMAMLRVGADGDLWID